MTPRGRWPTPPDGDNTPQGKLARGCTVLFYYVVACVVVIGIISAVVDWLSR